VLLERASGVILHPTSLPGPDGIGDLGPGARRWLEWLASTGCRYWQVLPLGPTGYGDSPYQCFSAVAGNPYLVSADDLLGEGLLHAEDLGDRPDLPVDHVDYGPTIRWKLRILDRAFQRFVVDRPGDIADAFSAFHRAHAAWLDDYSLFMAIKEECGGGAWQEWPEPIKHRDPDALDQLRERLAPEIERHAFRQFLFFRQWSALRHLVTAAGMAIVGDAPIFVAMDSADVWANPHLFDLDESLQPNHVAGVPPDYFSETGQLWGNPQYRWDVHAAEDYAWWIDRLRSLGLLVDVVRIDHFRGFVDYWEVPAGAPTAIEGRWVDGPGKSFFDVVDSALGGLPIIAEDLGELHETVPALRDELGLPGMKILQFAYDGDPQNDFLPEHYPENCVVYTGTHDNDTTRGWYHSLTDSERETVRRTAGVDGRSVAWDLMTIGWESRAKLAIAPMQDVLGLGAEARMNTPGTAAGNWTWRMGARALSRERAERLAGLNRRTGRHRAG
jgi:4-alpha-glucanotransferase